MQSEPDGIFPEIDPVNLSNAKKTEELDFHSEQPGDTGFIYLDCTEYSGRISYIPTGRGGGYWNSSPSRISALARRERYQLHEAHLLRNSTLGSTERYIRAGESILYEVGYSATGPLDVWGGAPTRPTIGFRNNPRESDRGDVDVRHRTRAFLNMGTISHCVLQVSELDTETPFVDDRMHIYIWTYWKWEISMGRSELSTRILETAGSEVVRRLREASCGRLRRLQRRIETALPTTSDRPIPSTSGSEGWLHGIRAEARNYNVK